MKNVLKLSILPIESVFIIEFNVKLKVKIAEGEIKERTAKEIRGKLAKVVEEDSRMERRNGEEELLRTRYIEGSKKKWKEEDYSGSLESMVWLRARTNSLNLGENSWQRNRDVCD